MNNEKYFKKTIIVHSLPDMTEQSQLEIIVMEELLFSFEWLCLNGLSNQMLC